MPWYLLPLRGAAVGTMGQWSGFVPSVTPQLLLLSCGQGSPTHPAPYWGLGGVCCPLGPSTWAGLCAPTVLTSLSGGIEKREDACLPEWTALTKPLWAGAGMRLQPGLRGIPFCLPNAQQPLPLQKARRSPGSAPWLSTDGFSFPGHAS